MMQPPFLNNWPTICEKNVQCQQVELTNPPTLRNEMVGGFFVICTSITSICAKGIRNGFHAGRIQRNQIDTCGIFLAVLKIHSAEILVGNIQQLPCIHICGQSYVKRYLPS